MGMGSRRGRHRRRREVRRIAGAVGTVVVATAAIALVHPGGHASRLNVFGLGGALVAPAPVTLPDAPSPSPHRPAAPRGNPLARAKGVTLSLPAPDPVGIGYHEASYDWALPLHPFGRLRINGNAGRFDPPPDTPGRRYVVMFSRGRGTPATSAVDVVLHPSTPVRSPVTGRVVDVHEYHLYCRYPDMSVTIAPRGHPRMSVILIHLTGVRVHRGDPVFATLSVIGFPRVFGFGSQVDDYFKGGNPHVHIEITRPHQARRTSC